MFVPWYWFLFKEILKAVFHFLLQRCDHNYSRNQGDTYPLRSVYPMIGARYVSTTPNEIWLRILDAMRKRPPPQ